MSTRTDVTAAVTEAGPRTRRVGASALAPVLTAALAAILPMAVGLYVAATAIGGTAAPWNPTMVDLEVYRQAGRAVLAGEDLYDTANRLPFLYPPFAALLAVPLAALPTTVVQVGWTLANVAALLAVLHRFGLTGWRLSLLGTATIWFVQPVQQTLAFGQVGILLVALVVIDLVPAPGAAERRRTGWLTGIAAAVKLTPGLFAVYAFLAGRRRVAITVLGSFLVAALVAAVALPSASAGFWGRLAHGDTGLGHSVIYTMNQSVMGSWLRVFGLGAGSSLAGLAVSAAVAVLGVLAAVHWHRAGEAGFAVCLGGIASLLASPVSWLHHFVWVVPLALCLWSVRRLPTGIRVLGWLFVGWVAAAPFQRLPKGGDVELDFTAGQNLIDSVTLMLGVALLLLALIVRPRRTRRPG